MRFLHTADWQLGMTRHFLAGDAQPRYSAARRDAVAGLGALAAEVGAEFVVVAGDVFEHNQLAPQVIGQSLEAMRAIGIPVYLLPGNHDPLDASSVFTSALFKAECPDNVIVLDRPGIHQVRPGVEIVAAPWRSKAPTTDLVAEVLDELDRHDTGPITRVLVAHGGVDVLDPDRDKPSLIRLAGLEQALTRGVVHYAALGDKHSLTQVGDGGRTWYSGSPEVTNFDDVESNPGHVLVVDIDDTNAVSVTPYRVGHWRFVTLHRQVDNSRDIADLDMNLDLMTEKDRTVVRLALRGSLTVTDRAALDACLDRYGRLFAYLGTWERHTDLAVIPADGEFTDLGIGGFAAAAVEELVATARGDDPESAGDAQAALALLLRLTDRGAA